MITIITGADVFAPEYSGINDVVIIGGRIALIERETDIEKYLALDITVDIISGEGKMLTPGIIDPHVHLIGGGGEGGYHTRTPETHIGQFIDAGITTAVGLIGTDKTSRSLEALYAKSKALTTEGITALMYTGNYQIPPPTITGTIERDLYLIDAVIGTAEIAISDHRSSQPTTAELAKIVAETRVGGMTAGKAGVTHFHTGGGKAGLSQLKALIEGYDLPAHNIYPTHVNRTDALIEEAAELTKLGAYVDMTAGEGITADVDQFKAAGGDMERLTLSSDGNGSLPVFDAAGDLQRLEVAALETLTGSVKALHESGVLSTGEVFRIVTQNTASVLQLHEKGRIKENMHADLLLFDEGFRLDTVIAKGKVLRQYGKTIVKSTFE